MKKFEKGKWYEYTGGLGTLLTKGKKYECLDVDSCGVLTVKYDNGKTGTFHQVYFNPEPVESKLRFEKGKWYECVKSGSEAFTTGLKYECISNGILVGDDKTHKVVGISEFKPVEPQQFKRGDMVEVALYDGCKPENMIYLETIEGAKFPIACVEEGDEDDFRNGDTFNITFRKHARPIQQTTITLKEAEVIASEKLGKTVKIKG